MDRDRMTAMFKKQFELCKVQEGETMVLLSDPEARPEFITASFAAAKLLLFNDLPDPPELFIEHDVMRLGEEGELPPHRLLIVLYLEEEPVRTHMASKEVAA